MPLRQPFLTAGKRIIENTSSCRIKLCTLLFGGPPKSSRQYLFLGRETYAESSSAETTPELSPPALRLPKSRTSAARFCPLIFCQGGGGGLTTTTIRARRPPRRDRLRLQWRTKTNKHSGRGGDNNTIDGSESNQQSTNDTTWRDGGATRRRHDEGRGHAHNNQIDHAEGG